MAAMVTIGSPSSFLAASPALPTTHRRSLHPTGVIISRRGSPSVVALRISAAAAGSSSNPAAPAEKKREPRGITKPRPVSPAMQALVGVPEIPRTQALKLIWAYIKEHNLQDPENKKIIVCDEKLKNIFNGKDRVGFLEISGLLNPHFMK